LGIRVRNFQGTKISMFDRNKKEMFRDLKEQERLDLSAGEDE